MCRPKRQTGQWTQEDEAGYQLYRQETDSKKRTFRVWYLIANPRGLPKEFVQKELEFRWKHVSGKEGTIQPPREVQDIHMGNYASGGR